VIRSGHLFDGVTKVCQVQTTLGRGWRELAFNGLDNARLSAQQRRMTAGR